MIRFNKKQPPHCDFPKIEELGLKLQLGEKVEKLWNSRLVRLDGRKMVESELKVGVEEIKEWLKSG